MAWRLINEITEIDIIVNQNGMKKKYHLYPHFLRLNRTTLFVRHPDTSTQDLRQWFGWRDPKTIESYMAASGKETKQTADSIT